jgi:hypothetical protein
VEFVHLKGNLDPGTFIPKGDDIFGIKPDQARKVCALQNDGVKGSIERLRTRQTVEDRNACVEQAN